VPPVASSSSEEETSCAGRNGFLKRMRESNVDLDSDVSLFLLSSLICFLFSALVLNFIGTLFKELVHLRKY
jgi:hypothetical protein